MRSLCISDLSGESLGWEVCRPHALLLVDEQDLVRALGAEPIELSSGEVIRAEESFIDLREVAVPHA